MSLVTYQACGQRSSKWLEYFFTPHNHLVDVYVEITYLDVSLQPLHNRVAHTRKRCTLTRENARKLWKSCQDLPFQGIKDH